MVLFVGCLSLHSLVHHIVGVLCLQTWMSLLNQGKMIVCVGVTRAFEYYRILLSDNPIYNAPENQVDKVPAMKLFLFHIGDLVTLGLRLYLG